MPLVHTEEVRWTCATRAALDDTLNYSGSGNQTTPGFTIGGDGDYIVYWTFSGNDTDGASGGDNFAITEGPQSDPNLPQTDLPNVIQTSGSGSAQASGDPGRHYFDVQATGSWTIKVVTAQ